MSAGELALDPRATALVLVDLQAGVLARAWAPRPAADVVATSARLADAARAAGALVVCVRVAFAPDGADALRTPTDAAMAAGARPEGWDALDPAIGPRPGDVVVTKRNWGAFFGTDLDVQLRRRAITTVVLGGIATNMGVESTARQAHEHGYAVVVAEDACASRDAEMHRFAIERVFPLLGRVRSSEQVVAALAAG